jgi:hypothetical protein
MNERTKARIWSHIHAVQRFMGEVTRSLTRRAKVHDASKLVPPESEWIEEHIRRFEGLEYGSPEFNALWEEQKDSPLFRHHQAANSHHPGFYISGVDGMSLLDIMEALADWKAAADEHGNSLESSIRINAAKFNISEQLTAVLQNTRMELNW